MLTGRKPFGGERAGMVHSILHEEAAVPARSPAPDAPSVLEGIVSHCLLKKPGDRPGRPPISLSGSPGRGALAQLRQRRGRTCRAGRTLTAGCRSPRRDRPRRPPVLAAFLLTRKPAPTVYVAVLKPEIAGSLSPDDQARVTANLQAALLRTVAAL